MVEFPWPEGMMLQTEVVDGKRCSRFAVITDDVKVIDRLEVRKGRLVALCQGMWHIIEAAK